MGYSSDFFKSHAPASIESARRTLPILLELTGARSIVDVGCGVGTWLSVARELGVQDVRGIDGPWVKVEELLIPRDLFQHHDLSRPFTLGRRFDLATSLEVGEHLPEASAAGFVDSITRLAPVVAFSAAIPGQGGTDHIHERWPGYWAGLFAERGYRAIDCVRPRIWADAGVAWWYAQNIVVYATDEAIASNPGVREAMARQGGAREPMALVHPGCFQTNVDQPLGLRRILRELPGAVASALRARTGRGGAGGS